MFFVTSKDYSLQDQDVLHATAGGRVGAGKQSLECAQKVEVDHRKKNLPPFLPGLKPGAFRSRTDRVQCSTTELFSAPAPPSRVTDLNFVVVESISTDNNIVFWGVMMMMMSWCLMSSDVSWHVRDKLWPMPKHGSIILYVHRNQKAR